MMKVAYMLVFRLKLVLMFLLLSIQGESSLGKVKTTILPGAFQTNLYFPFLKDKNIGIVANQTSLIGRTHLVDTLIASGFKVNTVFAPEHGFRGNKGAGEGIKNSVDDKTGIPIISLYGKRLGPSAADLRNIDIVIFDIQDVGVRFYTYISTLQYVMEACAENNKPLLILDRPNPHGSYVDGPVLDPKFSSFVGMQPVPVVYGMTIGEYAMLLNGEQWLRKKLKCELKVIPVRSYYHSSKYILPVPPSPNLPDMDAIYLYPSICFFEGTSVSLGRGTEKPFRYIGFPGYSNDSFSFKPLHTPGAAPHPPFEDTICSGMDLTGEGLKAVESKAIQLKWLLKMYDAYPNKDKFFNNFFDKLSGSDQLRKQIISKMGEEDIRKTWEPGINKFKEIRKKYLLYVDFE